MKRRLWCFCLACLLSLQLLALGAEGYAKTGMQAAQ